MLALVSDSKNKTKKKTEAKVSPRQTTHDFRRGKMLKIFSTFLFGGPKKSGTINMYQVDFKINQSFHNAS